MSIKDGISCNCQAHDGENSTQADGDIIVLNSSCTEFGRTLFSAGGDLATAQLHDLNVLGF